MATYAIKFIVILGFALGSNAFADSCEVSKCRFRQPLYACFDCEFEYIYDNTYVKEDNALVKYDTNKAGMVRARKIISELGPGYVYTYITTINDEVPNSEHITTVHDKKGKLMFSRHRIYKNNSIVQTTENGIVRKVIPGKTLCDFTIVEPSGDSISFSLDSRKKPEWTPRDEDITFFKHLKVPSKNKYDDIIYNRWNNSCQYSCD
jgi:hypothetical protein